jgi:hypothetical protein
LKKLTILFSICILFITCQKVYPQDQNKNVSIDIDPRTELLSIVCYLAGYEEYSHSKIAQYKSEVDEYFSKYKEHQAVQYAKKLKKTNRVGYDAPMSFAVHISDSIQPLVSFNTVPPTMDDRFRPEDLQEFMKLLNSFSKETNFDSFYRKEKLKYVDLIENYRNLIYSIVNFSWINPFFRSHELKNFYIIISLLNGENNYGPSTNINGEEKMYQIIGAYPIPKDIPKSQMDGLVRFEGIIIHEIGHSYLNKIIDNNTDKIKVLGVRLQNIYKNPQKSYYGWESIMKETLVRSFVICYMKENHDSLNIKKQIDFDRVQGFNWTEDVADIMMKSHKSNSIEEMLPDILMVLNNYCDKHPSSQ